jgi:hypothetical protein
MRDELDLEVGEYEYVPMGSFGVRFCWFAANTVEIRERDEIPFLSHVCCIHMCRWRVWKCMVMQSCFSFHDARPVDKFS